MSRATRFAAFLCVAFLAILAGAAYGQVTYMVDDGSAETSIGLTAGGYLWWANGFTVQPGGESITSIQVAYYLSNLPAGAPFSVAVYNDPDDDGDPTTGPLQLIASANGVVIDPATGTFQSIAVGPAIVSGGFFIAASMQQAVGQFPAALDQSTSAGGSWIAGSDTPIDLGNPLATATIVGRVDDFGFPGNMMLRAEGQPPAPPVPALAGWGMVVLVLALAATSLLGLRRRRVGDQA